MSDMSPELIGIISVGASLAVLFMGLFAWLRQDMKEQGQKHSKELGEQSKEITGLSKELAEQGQKFSRELAEQGQKFSRELAEQGQKHSDEITEVKIEVASLKATVETYFRVRVDPPQTAAVAEPPEDYGAD